MSDIFLCCMRHGLTGYIIGFIFILVILIRQTNSMAYGNSYIKENIIKEYIYDIKASAIAGIVALILGLIVGGVFEMVYHESNIHKWGMLIVPIITIGLALVSYLVIFYIGLCNWAKDK